MVVTLGEGLPKLFCRSAKNALADSAAVSETQGANENNYNWQDLTAFYAAHFHIV